MSRLSADRRRKEEYLNGYYTSRRRYKLSPEEKRKDIELRISDLEDPDERELLRLRYIKNKSMISVARIMNISRATAYRILGAALDNLRIP